MAITIASLMTVIALLWLWKKSKDRMVDAKVSESVLTTFHQHEFNDSEAASFRKSSRSSPPGLSRKEYERLYWEVIRKQAEGDPKLKELLAFYDQYLQQLEEQIIPMMGKVDQWVNAGETQEIILQRKAGLSEIIHCTEILGLISETQTWETIALGISPMPTVEDQNFMMKLGVDVKGMVQESCSFERVLAVAKPMLEGNLHQLLVNLEAPQELKPELMMKIRLQRDLSGRVYELSSSEARYYADQASRH